MLLAAEGDYRKVGNGTTARALRFVSILKSHHSSNRSHQGHGKRRKASGRSCLSALATACTTAGRTSAGICATAASSRYAEASARCLSARSRRSGVRQTTLDGSIMARQTVRCGDIGTSSSSRLTSGQLPSGKFETIARDRSRTSDGFYRGRARVRGCMHLCTSSCRTSCPTNDASPCRNVRHNGRRFGDA